jgi:hypothetical protein
VYKLTVATWWPKHLVLLASHLRCLINTYLVVFMTFFTLTSTLWLTHSGYVAPQNTLACSTSGFLTMSSVYRIVIIMSLVVLAAACLLILGSLGTIIIAQWTQWSPDCKMWNHSTSVHNWRYWQQASGIRGLIPQQLKYQDLWCIISILKQLYCICDASLDVLKINMLFIIGDLHFPIEQWFCLC